MKFLFQLSFIIIAGVIFFSVTNPLYKKISVLKADVNTYDTALKNSTDLQKIRDSLIDQYKSIKQEDKDRLEHFLPNSVNNIQLILEIEKVASLYGMPIKNIKFEGKSLVNPSEISKTPNTVLEAENPTADLPYGIFPLEFSVDGKYADFVYFLKDIELNLRMVDIKSVSFSVPQEKTASATPTLGGAVDPSIYSFTIKADIYWLK